jgi:predicted nucleic acid-binding Zn ribbon protein
MTLQDDRDDEDIGDHEDPDPSDQDAEDDPDAMTVPCPHCGADVFDEADICPRCGNFMLQDEVKRSRRPRSLWLLVGVIVCLAVVLLVWTRRG